MLLMITVILKNAVSGNLVSRTRCSVQRCSAESGPTRLAPDDGWTPDQQRNISCCAASGERLSTYALFFARIKSANRLNK